MVKTIITLIILTNFWIFQDIIVIIARQIMFINFKAEFYHSSHRANVVELKFYLAISRYLEMPLFKTYSSHLILFKLESLVL